MMKQRPPTEKKGIERQSEGRRFLALLFAIGILALVSLACTTSEIAFTVMRGEGDPQDPIIYAKVSQRLNQDYIRLAKEANRDMAEEYTRAYGSFNEDQKLPETLEKLKKESAELGMSDPTLGMDPAELEAKGWRRIRHIPGELWTYEKRFDRKIFEQEAGGVKLAIQEDVSTGAITYTFQMTAPGGLKGSDDATWAEWDALTQQQMPEKPKLPSLPPDPPKFESQGEELLYYLGKGVGELELRGWHYLNILRQTELFTIRFVVDLPGEIKAHEINGVQEGVIGDDGVVFDFGENYLRTHGPEGGKLRVVSVVEPWTPKEDSEDQDTDKKDQEKKTGQGFSKFRIRLEKFVGVSFIGGYALYEYTIQEVHDDDTLGRKCKVLFHGSGVVLSLPTIISFGFAPATSWSELTTRGGHRLRLEDFHNRIGTVSNVGAFVGGYSKITIGNEGNPADIVAESSGAGTAIGFWHGWEAMGGHFEITEAPH